MAVTITKRVDGTKSEMRSCSTDFKRKSVLGNKLEQHIYLSGNFFRRRCLIAGEQRSRLERIGAMGKGDSLHAELRGFAFAVEGKLSLGSVRPESKQVALRARHPCATQDCVLPNTHALAHVSARSRLAPRLPLERKAPIPELFTGCRCTAGARAGRRHIACCQLAQKRLRVDVCKALRSPDLLFTGLTACLYDTA